MVYTSLLCFTLLAALKLDGEINISWWTVFGPIWCWNGLVIAGALVGSGLGTNRIICFLFGKNYLLRGHIVSAWVSFSETVNFAKKRMYEQTNVCSDQTWSA